MPKSIDLLDKVSNDIWKEIDEVETIKYRGQRSEDSPFYKFSCEFKHNPATDFILEIFERYEITPVGLEQTETELTATVKLPV